MGVKSELADRVKSRLELTVECGFPQEGMESLVDDVLELPEKKLRDRTSVSKAIAEYGRMFSYSSYSDIADSFNAAEWGYIRYLTGKKPNRLAGKKEKNDYEYLSGILRNFSSAIHPAEMQLKEAKTAMWEYFAEMHNPVFRDIAFDYHMDLAHTYRQLINNPYWAKYFSESWKEIYSSPDSKVNLGKLCGRALRWFAEQPEEYLENATRDSRRSRIVALAFGRFGDKGQAEHYFMKAFYQAKKTSEKMQVRLKEDMHEAGIALPLKEKLRMAAKLMF